jgi:hypothetical protein
MARIYAPLGRGMNALGPNLVDVLAAEWEQAEIVAHEDEFRLETDMASETEWAVDPDITERLPLEADLCRNDGADDIATLLTDAQVVIEQLRGRVNHLTNVNDGLRETLDAQRAGLAELKAMLVAEKSA